MIYFLSIHDSQPRTFAFHTSQNTLQSRFLEQFFIKSRFTEHKKTGSWRHKNSPLGIRSFRSMVRSFQVTSFQRKVIVFHKKSFRSTIWLVRSTTSSDRSTKCLSRKTLNIPHLISCTFYTCNFNRQNGELRSPQSPCTRFKYGFFQ